MIYKATRIILSTNDINNTTSRMFGKDSSVYEDASSSKEGSIFALAS